MEKMLIEALIAWNLITCMLMIIDKNKAERGERRISERTLFLAAALLGAGGVLAGMYTVRHKTRHWSFRIGIPALLAVNLIMVYHFWQLGWL